MNYSEGREVWESEKAPLPPFLYLHILKDLTYSDFVSAHSKGVTEPICGSAHSKGLRRLANADTSHGKCGGQVGRAQKFTREHITSGVQMSSIL